MGSCIFCLYFYFQKYILRLRKEEKEGEKAKKAEKDRRKAEKLAERAAGGKSGGVEEVVEGTAKVSLT